MAANRSLTRPHLLRRLRHVRPRLAVTRRQPAGAGRNVSRWRFAGLALVLAVTMAACSTAQLINIAVSGDPKAALQAAAQGRLQGYAADPRRLVADMRQMRVQLRRLFGDLEKNSGKQWGEEEAKQLPGPRRSVKYGERYSNRVSVDYERGLLRVEHIESEQVRQRLQNAIVVALLTPEDPAAVDVFSDKPVQLGGEPFLRDAIANERGELMHSRAAVERFAAWLVDKRLRTRSIKVGGAPRKVYYVDIRMIGAEAMARNNYAVADRLAPRYKALVDNFAARAGVDPALVFGVIYQESRFNPNAVSPVGAQGLMQLMPQSGALDAMRKLGGPDKPPSLDYLRNPSNNIQLGSVYLAMLQQDYWPKSINDELSREYCAIAAYNTGAGNVARALTGSSKDRDRAAQRANSMAPPQLFNYLTQKLPYAETRDYLRRVDAARRHYHEKFYAAG